MIRHASRASVWLALALPGVLCPSAAGAQARSAAVEAVLVLPFDNGRQEPRLFWMQEGAAVLLADSINGIGGTAITRSERVYAFEQLRLPPVGAFSHATAIKLGQVLGAAEIVLGDLELSGQELTVRVRTIRLDSGRLRPEIVERAPIQDVVKLFGRLARRLVPARATAPEAPGPPAPAFENYIKGLLAKTPDTQVRYLEAALEVHPEYQRARLAIWEVRTAEGEHAAALASVSEVPPGGPFSRRAQFLAALSQIHLKQHDLAFTRLRSLQNAEPSASVLNNLGVIQLRRGWTPQTGLPTYYFNQAVERDPTDPDYYFNLGYAYWLEKDPKAAVYWLREAVRRNPADGDAHFVLGAALQATGTGVEAVREKELARQLSSKYDEWQRRPTASSEQVPRGLERLKTELQPPRAQRVEAAILNNVQREQQEVASFHLERARRLFAADRDQEAIAELRRAIFLSPYLAEAHLLMGQIHLRSGRSRSAVDALKISIWCDETAAAQAALGEAYFRLEDRALAKTAAQRALVLDPSHEAARALLNTIDKAPLR
jgi:tetratricopeptide (TPR) repeat protein